MFLVFFFNDTATTEIYTLSLHDALPISTRSAGRPTTRARGRSSASTSPMSSPTPRSASSSRTTTSARTARRASRSEEHTSELQSRQYLVCRLLLEKKNLNILISHLLPFI